jgi:hypothetical protein
MADPDVLWNLPADEFTDADWAALVAAQPPDTAWATSVAARTASFLQRLRAMTDDELVTWDNWHPVGLYAGINFALLYQEELTRRKPASGFRIR